MSESQGTSPAPFTPYEKGINFETIKNAIPTCHIQASPERRAALKETKPVIPEWYNAASQEQKKQLKENSELLCKAQNEQDKLFSKLKSIENFSKNLLLPELKKLDNNLDADDTWLRLYTPKNLGIFGLKSGAFQVKTLSLLNAALHNFEEAETKENLYDDSSRFITKPDNNGHFERFSTSVKIEEVIRLCRTLDIGGNYQEYIKKFLRPDSSVEQALLHHRVTTYQKEALKTASYLALLKKDIDQDDYNLLMRVVSGEQNIMDGEKPLSYRSLSVMGLRLSGCMLFMPCVKHHYHLGYLIAWIPDDPEHPIKKYASFADFQRELTRQFMSRPAGSSEEHTDYQRFFSRFVAQRDKPYYFQRFTEKVTDGPEESFTSQWRRHELVRLAESLLLPSSIAPAPDRGTRQDPSEAPHFYIIDINMHGKGQWEDFDLWPVLLDDKLDKLIKDARIIAVPTADEDAKTRSNRWANYLNIGFIAVGALALVVPGLGEVMLVTLAGQLLYEVLEGVVELSEGDKEAGWAHITDVIENLATAVALAPVFHYTVSPFIEGLKSVNLPGGKTKLWKPDLEPYQYKGTLPENAVADKSGLYQHDGKTILSLGQKRYEVKKNPQTNKQTIQHPVRLDAYEPELIDNGAGTYVIEGEEPRAWDDVTLMRRLGPLVKDYSDLQCEDIRKISGTGRGELRRMYVENDLPPPLLADTFKRFSIDQDIQRFIDQMNSDESRVYAKADPKTQLHIMTRYGMWPDTVSMRVIGSRAQTIWEYAAPNVQPNKKLVVQIHDQQINNGELLKTVMETLDANGTSIILDQAPGTPREPLEVRTRQLRKRIASVAESKRVDLFNDDYASQEELGDKPTELIKRRFSGLPTQGIKKLLTTAKQSELKIMTDEDRLPLRLKNTARELQFEARTTRAYEGFYRDSLLTPDTERLALNALRIYTDSLAELRIEIRENTYDGNLSVSAGPQEASTVRILVKDKQLTYEVRDSENKKLHKADDLYQSILRALPDDKRAALGYQIGEGGKFKQWLMAKTEPPTERRTILAEPPIRRTPDRETLILLRGPSLSKAGMSLEERVQDLYPHLSEREVNTFIQSLNATGDPFQAIGHLTKELNELRELLSQWRYQHLKLWTPGDTEFSDGGGMHIADQLLKCFVRKSKVFGERSTRLEGGYALDLSTEFRQYNLEHWWKKLPEIGKYLDQISVLNLDSTGFTADATGLLKNFPNLRQLSARNCELTRLPEGIGRMRLLETLRLTDNRIQLTATHVEQLRDLTRLETLRLDDNPLGALVNVARMPRLSVLSLSNTGINTWPLGIFSKPRPRGLFLDLQRNPITEIPEVIPGSDDAFIVARTRLSASDLSDANRVIYQGYRRSVGISPEQIYNPVNQSAIDKWLIPDDSQWWSKPSGLEVFRKEAWSDLRAEPTSDGFFMVLDKLTTSADYKAGGQSRQQLSARVWRMIDAIDLDTALREDLFTMATSPATCADAGAQLFNTMGIKVLASEAYSLSTSAAPLEKKLVTLAKGAARLERVNDIARADLEARTGTPDEVEVYLAYQTGLAQRLDLPWQSDQMLFQAVSGVEKSSIDQAFDTIISFEEGDGLVNKMIEQPFWNKYLLDTHPTEFKNNALLYEGKSGLLDELRRAQNAWADSKDLPEAQRNPLKEQLKDLADELSVPQSVVFTDEAMTEGVYERLYSDLGYDEQELSRRLTRAALKKAGL